ncbi:MAG: hypothetical protein ABR512_02450 [Desulfopila sp.]
MKRVMLVALTIFSLMSGSAALAMEGMDHGSKSADGTFKHATMAGNVHAEFQVMDLASMNMKDPAGNTHHVMASFTRDGAKIEKVAGKVKLISPSGEEQLAVLKDFGSGVFAANFTIDEPGKWGVICVFKDAQEQQVVKFRYPHMAM